MQAKHVLFLAVFGLLLMSTAVAQPPPICPPFCGHVVQNPCASGDCGSMMIVSLHGNKADTGGLVAVRNGQLGSGGQSHATLAVETISGLRELGNLSGLGVSGAADRGRRPVTGASIRGSLEDRSGPVGYLSGAGGRRGVLGTS